MSSLAEPGPIGIGPIAIGENPGVPSLLYAAAAAAEGQIYLLEMYPAPLGTSSGLGPGGEPIGVNAIGVPPLGSTTSVDEVMLRYSDAGYVSPPGGAFGSMYWEGRVSQALRLTRTLPVTPEEGRQVLVEVAGMDIAAGDGGLDGIIQNYSIDGRRVCVKFGMRGYAYEEFKPIFTGRAAASWRSSFDMVSVTCRDESYRLNVTLQQGFYDGTGGIGGTTELSGKPRPLTFGICRNVSPVLIDPTNLIYQFHARTASDVDAVYDRRAALIDDGDVANYAALTAAVISTGHFKTCLALGLFRLGSTPSGVVTADVKGDAEGGYINTTGAIIARLIDGFVGLGPSEYDGAAFAALDVATPGFVGWYQSAEIVSAADVVSQLAHGIGAWWGGTTSGVITAGRLEPPDGSNIAIYLESWDIDGVALVDAPPGTSPPRFRQRVAYARNWTVQRGEDLAGTVSAADRQLVAEPYSIAGTVSAAAQADFLLAQDPPVLESFFDSEADAQAEADRLIDLLAQQRMTVRVMIGYRGHLTQIGAMASIQHPRINGGARWSGRVIQQTPDADRRRATFTLWG